MASPTGSEARPSNEPEAPIALFDSGVGGLTVLEAIARRRPLERMTYVADQTHVPYGGRPLTEIRSFAEALSVGAFRRGAKLVVMACNISSATYSAEAEHRFGAHRTLGVIGPGAKAAVSATRRGAIGVLATKGTVESGAYTTALRRAAPEVLVTEVACPRFVPLIEAGDLDSPAATAACSDALEALPSEVDTVVYGCTHYPFLGAVLRRLAPELRFVDPAEATAEAVDSWLSEGKLAASTSTSSPEHELMTTGDPAQFGSQALELLSPDLSWRIGPRWTDGRAA